MRKLKDRAVSAFVAVAVVLFVTAVIGAVSYIASQNAAHSYKMQGMTSGEHAPSFKPFPTGPWK